MFNFHRKGKNMIMCSSDVSARGMDYPDVTFVLQVGTTEKDNYIHRSSTLFVTCSWNSCSIIFWIFLIQTWPYRACWQEWHWFVAVGSVRGEGYV